MIELAILQNFLLAIALGTLVGLEREYARFKKRGHSYAGIRTFPLISLFGALAAFLGNVISPWILYISMMLLGILIIVAYYILAEHDVKHSGATSELAGFLVFFIGMFCFYGEFTFAISLTVITTIILYSRSVLHHLAETITKKEMRDTIIFIMIAFVVLPLLPNQWYGPRQLFNPYILWLMIVLVSGISFFGYVLVRRFGEKGIELTGILGGLVGSTPMTINFSERSKKEKKIYRALALGVILANSVMFIRVLTEVFIINQPLFKKVVLPILALTLITGSSAYFLWKKMKHVANNAQIESPLKLISAVKFGLFFAGILALVKIAEAYLSNSGVYLISFLSGIANMDAITVTLSQLAKSGLALETASKGIFLAMLTNLTFNTAIAYWIGRKDFSRIILRVFIIVLIAGGLIFWWM
ncbi:MgtC/SapB family protein [Candidatus Woesearchaeota archaeon]|nr:MgtC/SapB family protein [Candidatus Woesearchaeota archaeon]